MEQLENTAVTDTMRNQAGKARKNSMICNKVRAHTGQTECQQKSKTAALSLLTEGDSGVVGRDRENK